MAKLFDINGNEVEAFTGDELKAKQDEAVQSYLKENPDKSADIEKLKKDLEEATKKLEEAGKGNQTDQQKERLRQQRDEATTKLETFMAEANKKIDDLKNSFTSSAKTKVLNALTKGDKDLLAKIELKAANLSGYDDTEQGIAQKYQDAYTLATGSKPTPNFMDGLTGAGDRGNAPKDGNSAVESENAKQMRGAFGIDDKSAEKYSKEITK